MPAASLLETPRLRLRQSVQHDWPAYAAMYVDAELMRHIGSGVPRSKEDAWRSIAVAQAIGKKLHGQVELLGSPALMYEANCR